MKYQIIECSVELDGINYTSYGIGYVSAGTLLFVIKDLTLNRARVEKFVSLCNDLQLDPIHIDDAVEDFLAD